ncbi:MAG: sensor histidine kinase [Planctomycetota bacterium]|nr:sensor histidine kinase [Planctomycetota bacterium]
MLNRGLAVIACLLATFAVFSVIRLVRRRRRVLSELERGLEALTTGLPARPVTAAVGGRLADLARAFNEMAPEVEAHLATLEGDRQLLGAVLGGMTESVIAVDARRRLLFANEAAARLFSLSTGSVGRLVAELVRSPRVQAAVDATLMGPKPHRDEIILAVPDSRPLGGSRSLAVQGTPLPGSPPTGAVLVFHDVTDLRRLERMRQDFVANASHELKTPLAAIKAYTETLLDGALHDAEVNTRFLTQIDEQTDRLNQLILDLLSLARLESGQDAFHHGPLQLGPIVRKIAQTYRGRAEAKGIVYDLDLTSDLLWVNADEEAMRQILDNLIDNALKYTPGGGRVAVSCQATEDLAILTVTDTGLGIPRDDQPRVFERFYRVDKARSRELGGTGLGLAIVKHLTQSLGGQITVESRVGQGSVFTVSLPRLDEGAEE